MQSEFWGLFVRGYKVFWPGRDVAINVNGLGGLYLWFDWKLYDAEIHVRCNDIVTIWFGWFVYLILFLSQPQIPNRNEYHNFYMARWKLFTSSVFFFCCCMFGTSFLRLTFGSDNKILVWGARWVTEGVGRKCDKRRNTKLNFPSHSPYKIVIPLLSITNWVHKIWHWIHFGTVLILYVCIILCFCSYLILEYKIEKRYP